MTTEYGKLVKKTLIDLGKSAKELSEEVAEATGLYCSSAYLSKVLSGERNAPKIRAAINDILGIEEA